ncbi:MAG: ABC transporter permease [Rhodospirillaceae bacterium]|nr:ABC transporter permease [Rhodospirillaceae bacterium]
MKEFIFQRVLQSIVTLIGVTIIVFCIVRLTGDPTDVLLPLDAPEEVRIQVYKDWGFDRPWPVQYLIFILNAVKGDFGESLRWKVPALSLVKDRLPATIELAVVSSIFSLLFALPMGILSSIKPGSIVDKLGKTVALFGQAVPPFWVGMMLILIFSVHWKILPTSGRGTWQQLIMPSITIGWFFTASVMRLTRSSMLEVLRSEYIKLARIKGLSEVFVVGKHALKNAAIPVITMISLQFGAILGGAVITETIFTWPGMGRLVVEAIFARDYSVVQAAVLVFATFFVGINLSVDLLYGLLDPRIRYEGR